MALVRKKQKQRLVRSRPRKPTAVGAYIFAGGFTLGVEQHFDVLAHLETGKFGVETVRKNRPELPVHVSDPGRWPTAELRRRGVDLVYCNPPCAPWSTAGINAATGERLDWRKDPRSACVGHCAGLIEQLSPLVWTFESVRQVHSKGSELLDSIIADAAGLGYAATHLFTQASEHGVPQHRKRYFLVLSKVLIDWEAPPPGDDPTVDQALDRVEAERFADHDEDMGRDQLPEPVAAVAGLMAPGEGARKAYDRAMALGGTVARQLKKGKRPSFLYDRLRGDGISYTILGTPNKLHPREDRIVTTNETKAICGFPADWKLSGGQANRYAELGRGVMPPVAEWLAANLKRAIMRGEPVEAGAVETIRVMRGKITKE